MKTYYDKQAEGKNTTSSNDLFKVGDEVRIKKQQPKGSTKFHHMPYSVQIYTIKQVRIPTRSYLLEAVTEKRQPLQFLCHHRRCKKIFQRPEHLYTEEERRERRENNQIEKNKKKNQENEENNVHNEENNEENNEETVNSRKSRTGRNIRRPAHLKNYAE